MPKKHRSGISNAERAREIMRNHLQKTPVISMDEALELVRNITRREGREYSKLLFLTNFITTDNEFFLRTIPGIGLGMCLSCLLQDISSRAFELRARRIAA